VAEKCVTLLLLSRYVGARWHWRRLDCSFTPSATPYSATIHRHPPIITSGIVSAHAAGAIALATFEILTLLQIGYLAGSILEAYLPVRITMRYRLSELPNL